MIQISNFKFTNYDSYMGDVSEDSKVMKVSFATHPAGQGEKLKI